jgi:nitrite reductase/ring-hydroxylating ferredoxin subunit
VAEHTIPSSAVPEKGVAKAGPWAVARSGGEVHAVSGRCRHQFADLSKGTVSADGCLVCPWHGSRYQLDSGRMVAGPKGFLWYVGRIPGYTPGLQKVLSLLPLRRRPVSEADGTITVR